MTNASTSAPGLPSRQTGPVGSLPGHARRPSNEPESVVNTIASLNSTPLADWAGLTCSVSPTGIVAGTVLRAARLSAGRTQVQLAAVVDADEASVADWEDGTKPLATLPYAVVARLEAALTAADPELVSDLTVATWCDLVIEAITGSEDIRCLMADPIAAEQSFTELMTWAMSGNRPARYCQYVGRGALLRNDLAAASAIQQIAGSLAPSPRAA